MKKTRFYQWKNKIIGSIIMIGIFFGGWSSAEIINTEILINGLDHISEENLDSENFTEMVKYFCDAVANGKEGGYDSSQSLFVYYICKSEKKTTFFSNKGFKEDAKTSYTKFTTNSDGEEINKFDNLLPGFYYDTENFVKKLFDTLISSYTTIYQANIYGYSNDPDKTPEEIIHENFAKKYLAINTKEFIKICATDDENFKYTKTCKKLKEYFYGAKNLINTNTENILNDQNIYKATPKNCSITYKNNLIPCGLYGGNITYFTTMVYNELMFYALFVDYYSYLLQNNSNFKNRDVKEFQKKLANNQNRTQTMFDNIETSRNATQTTIKALKELQYTFPIHIGFLMYSEDIYKFTSSMNKTLTPIYTLHDILRNVQKTE